MKLKRLLSGVTAAIMALSSVAITSFTSVSASELADNAPYQWTGKWQRQTGMIDEGKSQGGLLVEDFGGSWQMCVSEYVISDMKNPTFEVEFEGSDPFQVATTDDETGKEFNEFGRGSSGQSVLIPEEYRSESRFLISTDGSTSTITKISIYDDPNPPAQPEAFTSITYNFTVTEGGNTTVTFVDPDETGVAYPSESKQVTTSGDYTVNRVFSSPRISLPGLGMLTATPNIVKIKVKSIVVNDKYTFDVGLEITSDVTSTDNALPHVYRADGQAAVVYKTDGAYIAGGANIKLMIGEAPEVVEKPKPTAPPYSGKTYTPQLSYFDGNKSFDARGNDKTYGGPIAEIGGTYTLGIDLNDFKNWPEQTASGITCLYIDMLGMASAFGAKTEVGVNDSFDAAKALAISKGLSVTNLSIITDGIEFYKYKDSDIYFGDFGGNGNLRIDLVNVYSNVEVPDDLNSLMFLFSAKDKIQVKFTITTLLTNSSNTVSKNPTTVNPAENPTTVNPAENSTIPTNTPIIRPNIIKVNTTTKPVKIVNTKKVTKPGKPKITYTFNPKTNKIKVKWKKVKGATGYQYKIALTKKFKKEKKKLINKKSFTYKLKFNQKYTISVRAYKIVGNKMYYGKWTTKKIRLKKV